MIEEPDSFFYDKDESLPFYWVWTKNVNDFPKDLDKSPIITKGILFKKGKTLKLTKTRIYFITDEFLYYKEVINFF